MREKEDESNREAEKRDLKGDGDAEAVNGERQ